MAAARQRIVEAHHLFFRPVQNQDTLLRGSVSDNSLNRSWDTSISPLVGVISHAVNDYSPVVINEIDLNGQLLRSSFIGTGHHEDDAESAMHTQKSHNRSETQTVERPSDPSGSAAPLSAILAHFHVSQPETGARLVAEVNEVYLWHGSKRGSFDSIRRHGLHSNFANEKGWYGLLLVLSML